MYEIELNKTTLDKMLTKVFKKEIFVRTKAVSMIPFESDYKRQGKLIVINKIEIIGLMIMVLMLYIKHKL